MKAITISQPFAFLIATDQKFVENRTWETSYRGPLAIHAGSGTQYLTKAELAGYITGAIVATCEIVSCVVIASPSEKSVKELDNAGISIDRVLAHEHCEGPVAWVLSGVRPVSSPVYIPGKQRLWEFDESKYTEELAY